MKRITKYKTDGICSREFIKKDDATKWEADISKLEDIFIDFPKPKDEHCEFVNGGGYYQLDIEKYKKAKKRFMDFCRTFSKDFESYQEAIDYAEKSENNYTMLGRYLDDSSNDHLYHFWGLLSCVDTQGRLWGQTYYALNPERGKQIKLTHFSSKL